MELLTTQDDRLAVIDVETTGVLNQDRIVEVAVVVLDRRGHVIDEYDTLVNPERDVGPTEIHGITAAMVSAAPTFSEVAASLARRLDQSVIVAHNLSFDSRLLVNEFSRIDAELHPGQGICTLRLAGERLELACERNDISLTEHHRALSDARATAHLLAAILDETPDTAPASVQNLTTHPNPRTLRREATGGSHPTPLRRVIAGMPYPTTDGRALSYLGALDWVLDDLVITDVEAEHLERVASDLGMSVAETHDVNCRYVQLLVSAALQDGIITEQEHALMDTVARALNVSLVVPAVTDLPKCPTEIRPGTRVCFTGSAVGAGHRKIDRSELEVLAAEVGLQPVGTVTKKNCDLLVAADPASSSGKAAKARRFEIPVLSVSDFCRQVGSPLCDD